MEGRLVKRVLLASALCFSGLSAHALTLSTIRTAVRAAVRDTSSDSTLQRYSDATLLTYINEAQKEMVSASLQVHKVVNYTLVSATTFYDLPDDFLGMFQVTYRAPSSARVELKEVSLRSLTNDSPNWQEIGGKPYEYVVIQATTTTAQRIGFIQPPSSSSTGTVTVEYFDQCADLAGDSDVPFDGAKDLYPYHVGLAYQVIMRLKFEEGLTDQATVYQQLYQNTLNLMKGVSNSLPNYSPGARGTGSLGR